jgi:hypothetical protein
MKDLFNVIYTLMATKKKKIVHFALDFYIIILAGQRFLADSKKLETGIIELIRKNTFVQSNVEMVFPMVIGKTQLFQ